MPSDGGGGLPWRRGRGEVGKKVAELAKSSDGDGGNRSQQAAAVQGGQAWLVKFCVKHFGMRKPAAALVKIALLSCGMGRDFS